MHSSKVFLKWVRVLVVLIPPLLLFLLELSHPIPLLNETPWETIQSSEGWWLNLHVLQLFLLCGLGFSVICLTASTVQPSLSLPLYASISIFLSFYSTLDAVTGIASGIVVANSAELSKSIQVFGNQIIFAFLNDPVVGGGTFSITALLGGGSWLASMILLSAIAKKSYQVGNWVVVMLIVSGISFGLSHLPPTGPLGMFCYVVASIIILFRQNKQACASTSNPVTSV
jgi:hypothetical protein